MKKILVLEDEANIRSFVVINLNRAGYETIEAGSGEEALEQLRRQATMTRMTGRKRPSRPTLKNIPPFTLCWTSTGTPLKTATATPTR